jgi:hypothetical protein
MQTSLKIVIWEVFTVAAFRALVEHISDGGGMRFITESRPCAFNNSCYRKRVGIGGIELSSKAAVIS